VVVTSDENVADYDSVSEMKQRILEEAKVEKDWHSWIAAEIQVRYKIAVAVTLTITTHTTSSNA
jgi:hypothetical protein